MGGSAACHLSLGICRAHIGYFRAFLKQHGGRVQVSKETFPLAGDVIEKQVNIAEVGFPKQIKPERTADLRVASTYSTRDKT